MSQDRAHAILGASSAKRWMKCTLSAAIEQAFPDEASEYAREGTCAHGVFECRLRSQLLGETVDETQTPDYAEFFNAEFSGHVQSSVDFVVKRVEELRAQHGRDSVTILLEQRLDFSRWVPQGFGTGDVVVIVPGRVVVMDYKHGAGVYVSGENNEQIRLYALGAYDRYHILYDFEEVEVWILQPRKDNTSGESLRVDDLTGLLTWADELVRPRATIAWAAVEGDRTNASFAPGEHCASTFCRARFQCAARARYMLEAADKSYALKEPDTLTIEQLEEVVERADLAVKWLSDVKSYLLKQAEAGRVQLQRFELVEGRSNRTISDTKEAAAVLMKNGFSATDIYKDPELKGLTMLEKLVGAKKLTELLGNILHKPAGKPTLAPRGSGKKAVEVTPKKSAAQEFNDD
jgi:hypothetical protein